MHVMVADVIKSSDTVDRSILDCALGRLGLPFLAGFVGIIFLFIGRFVSGSSLLLALVSLGVGTVVSLRVVHLVWCLLWPCMSRGVVILSLCLMFSRSFMLIILSVPVHFLILLVSLHSMSGRLDQGTNCVFQLIHGPHTLEFPVASILSGPTHRVVSRVRRTRISRVTTTTWRTTQKVDGICIVACRDGTPGHIRKSPFPCGGEDGLLPNPNKTRGT